MAAKSACAISCSSLGSCAMAESALAAETANDVPGTDAPRDIASTTATRTPTSESPINDSS